MKSSEVPVGRYAPSPTGALHLGNLRTAVAAYCFARSRGGKFLLRIEDIDLPRVKPGAEETQLADLAALGIEWDEPPIRQSERTSIYQEQFARLVRTGLAYRCFCSRRDIQLALSAPHREDNIQGYPGTCRALSPREADELASSGRPFCWRINVTDAPKKFSDGFKGEIDLDLEHEGGDFVVLRADGFFAYQFVCAIDDALSGVNEVVRGDDLLDSGARQRWLLDVLGFTPPRYYHIPLMMGANGERLSKRTGAADLRYWLSRGQTVGTVLSMLGRSLGQEVGEGEVRMAELVRVFEMRRVPKEVETTETRRHGGFTEDF